MNNIIITATATIIATLSFDNFEDVAVVVDTGCEAGIVKLNGSKNTWSYNDESPSSSGTWEYLFAVMKSHIAIMSCLYEIVELAATACNSDAVAAPQG
jgi:hypothetical protein